MFLSGRGVLAVCATAALAAALHPALAWAAGPPVAFSIPAKALPDALTDFAVQADLSMGAEAARNCRAKGNPVVGRLTIEEGLTRLLAGTGCSFRMIDATTVQIVRAPRRAPFLPAPIATPSAQPPHAETPAPAAEGSIDEVVVTSTKRSIGLDRAPYALSAVQGAALDEAGAIDSSGLGFKLSGLTVTNLGPGRNKMFVRGLSDGALTGRTQATVGLYLDDVRLTYNAPDPDLRLVDIERVELLRGPQGSLYGAGSIGGILQVTSKAPDPVGWSGFISAGGEATAGGSPGGIIEAMVNAPIVKDRLALRLVGYHEVLGGYIDDAGLGLRDVGRTVREGARATLAVEINPAWSASVGFVAQTLTSNDTHYSQAGLAPLTRSLYVREPHRNDLDETRLAVTGDLGWARLKATGALQAHEMETRYDASVALPAFLGLPLSPAPFDEDSQTDAAIFEVTLTSKGPAVIDWLAGVFSSEISQTMTSNLAVPPAIGSAYREVRRDDIDEYAAYGEATWNLTQAFSVTGGGRYFKLVGQTRARTQEPLAGSDFAGSRSDHGFSPKVVVRYDFSPRLIVYGQVSQGFRAGGFNTSGRTSQIFSDAGATPRRRFTADELTSVETGARLSLMDDALKLRAALFQAHWENIQADQLLPSGLPYTANIGDGHNRGVEIEAAWRRGSWRIDGNLIFNDPELDKPAAGFDFLADRGLPGVAKLSGTLSARYQWRTPDGGLAPFVSGEAGYVGGSALPFDSALSPQMGRYWTTKVSAGLIGERWRLTAYADNLFDSAGDTFAYGNPFGLRLAAQQTPQRPRTVGATLTREF